MAVLGGNWDLLLGASFLLRQKFNKGLKLFPRRLHDKRLRWPKAEGREDFALEGSEGREGLGISDLISLEYVHALYLTNFRFTSSSLKLSPE